MLNRAIRGLAAAAAYMALAMACTGQRSTPVQVVHPAGAASDNFGSSCAVSGDTMVVGAPNDDVGANANQGSVHVYRWTGSGWNLEATLVATDGSAADALGVKVAISGDTIVAGAWLDDNGAVSNQGSAYVFVRTGTVWAQQAKLTAADGAANDFFGSAVGIYGNTVVVGANFDDVGGNADQGSAYVFTRTGTVWTEAAKLTAVDGAAQDHFGFSVAIWGDSIAVGSYTDDNGAITDQGSAYVFVRSDGGWALQVKLYASDGAAGDSFGSSIAISEETVLVGAQGDDVGANSNQGSAYAFVRSGTTWSEQWKLIASDGAAGDVLGQAVAVSGDMAVVGAAFDDVNGALNQGSAYVFVRSGISWYQQIRLEGPDGTSGDGFGQGVAVSGTTVVVGAGSDDVEATADQGSAWVFSRVGGTWVGPDRTVNASTGEQIGVSVAISGNTMVTGAPNQASAIVFVRSETGWLQQARLSAGDGAGGDDFGRAVGISSEIIVVGARNADVDGKPDQGAAYVFMRLGTVWTQVAKLVSSDGAEQDHFGTSVAIYGETVVVGADYANVDGVYDSGAAYVFVRSGDNWVQQAKLAASDGAQGDCLGNAVAIWNDTVVAGAWCDDDTRGSASVFVRSGTTWTQQAKLMGGGWPGTRDGTSVAISGGNVVMGSPYGQESGGYDYGRAFPFHRAGTNWEEEDTLYHFSFPPFVRERERFGESVALYGDMLLVSTWGWYGNDASVGNTHVFCRAGSRWFSNGVIKAMPAPSNHPIGPVSLAIWGDTAIMGLFHDAVGPNWYSGSVRVMTLPLSDFPTAERTSIGLGYGQLFRAVSDATTGEEISATEAAWREADNIDTGVRNLTLRGDGDVRAPWPRKIVLNGTSALRVGPANFIELDGSLRSGAGTTPELSGGRFLLGSRGDVEVGSVGTLTINMPTAELLGSTRVNAGATLTFAGSARVCGPVWLDPSAALVVGGTLTSSGAASMGEGSAIVAPLVQNLGTMSLFEGSSNGSSVCGILGPFINDAGAVTKIGTGTVYVTGPVSNYGTIVGEVCPTCPDGAPGISVDGDLVLGVNAAMKLAYEGSLVTVGGSVDSRINSNERFDLARATLRIEGSGGERTLEAMSTDIGVDVSGLDRTVAGHYPIRELQIGPATMVRVVDARDNDGRAGCEAIYVETLVIEAGGMLNNTGCPKIYYRTLVNDGAVAVPGNLVALPLCLADIDGDGTVDLLDFFAFFNCWDSGADCAELTGDKELDLLDFFAFFNAWDQSC